jgi:hypothetical protein
MNRPHDTMEATQEEIKEKFDLPTDERAQELRNIFQEYHEPLDEDAYTPWKGRVVAVVEPSDDESVKDVREAMDFVGAIVDNEKELPDGSVKLFSRGYYHHIGA